jgi:hypothetical protein
MNHMINTCKRVRISFELWRSSSMYYTPMHILRACVCISYALCMYSAHVRVLCACACITVRADSYICVEHMCTHTNMHSMHTDNRVGQTTTYILCIQVFIPMCTHRHRHSMHTYNRVGQVKLLTQRLRPADCSHSAVY